MLALLHVRARPPPANHLDSNVQESAAVPVVTGPQPLESAGRRNCRTGDCKGWESPLVGPLPGARTHRAREAGWRRGAVAQMGERCNRTAEVRGSIHLSSTSLFSTLELTDICC